MQKTKLLARVTAGAMLSLALATLCGQVVQARSTSLLRFRCVSSGPGRWSDNEADVAIGRAVYRSVMNLNPSNGSAAVTCRIRADNDPKSRFQTLDLRLGMLDRDEGSPPAVVNVYLDGQQSATKTISAGQPASFSLDVSNVNNVSIETICSSRVDYCSRVYVFRAALEHISNSNK